MALSIFVIAVEHGRMWTSSATLDLLEMGIRNLLIGTLHTRRIPLPKVGLSWII